MKREKAEKIRGGSIMPFCVAITGASGSGKTLLADALRKNIGVDNSFILEQDRYYFGLPKGIDPFQYNFDSPDKIDWEKMEEDLNTWRHRAEISAPKYDFISHTRYGEEKIAYKDVLIIEGTLLLTNEKLRPYIDLSVFLDIPPDICLVRRIQRDIQERGRDIYEVINRYIRFVRPIYYKYILPSKRHAEIIIAEQFNLTEACCCIAQEINKSKLVI